MFDVDLWISSGSFTILWSRYRMVWKRTSRDFATELQYFVSNVCHASVAMSTSSTYRFCFYHIWNSESSYRTRRTKALYILRTKACFGWSDQNPPDLGWHPLGSSLGHPNHPDFGWPLSNWYFCFPDFGWWHVSSHIPKSSSNININTMIRINLILPL